MFGKGDYPKKGVNWFFVVFYLVIGIYFLNYPFQLIKIPEFIIGINDWIMFVAGIFMLIGAFNSIKVGRSYS